jgi:hypothetical protein
MDPVSASQTGLSAAAASTGSAASTAASNNTAASFDAAVGSVFAMIGEQLIQLVLAEAGK